MRKINCITVLEEPLGLGSISYTDIDRGHLHSWLYFPSLGWKRRKGSKRGDWLNLLFYNVLRSLRGLLGDDGDGRLDDRDDLIAGGGGLTALDTSDSDSCAHLRHHPGGELGDWSGHPDMNVQTEVRPGARKYLLTQLYTLLYYQVRGALYT